VLTIGLILLVVIFWIAINYSFACAFDAMELTLLYLQCVALSLNYDVNWPEKLLVIKHWISIFVFEVAHSRTPRRTPFCALSCPYPMRRPGRKNASPSFTCSPFVASPCCNAQETAIASFGDPECHSDVKPSPSFGELWTVSGRLQWNCGLPSD
jgi:hypothetical protein